eukprot:11634266-Ditylum_brightwellii.AAC.1
MFHYQTPDTSYKVTPQETYLKQYEPRLSIPLQDISRPKTQFHAHIRKIPLTARKNPSKTNT